MVHKVTVLTKPGVSEPRVSKALIAFDIIGQSIDKEKENGGKSTPRVINCSWGISDAIGKVLDADKNSFSAALDTLTHTYKCVVVVAAGNDSVSVLVSNTPSAEIFSQVCRSLYSSWGICILSSSTTR